MARDKKAVDVGTYRHPNTGDSVTVMLDRNTMEYYASFKGIRYGHKDYDEFKKLLAVKMLKNHDIAWMAVIKVNLNDSYKKGAIALSYERILVGNQADGERLVSCKWSVQEEIRTPATNDDEETTVSYVTHEGLGIPKELRVKHAEQFSWSKEAGPFVPPIRYLGWNGRPENRWFLPFTDATWEQLAILDRNLDMLREALVKLVDTSEGRRMLEEGNSKLLLGAPEVVDG